MSKSFIDWKRFPQTFLADLVMVVPLWGVKTLSINASYHLPPIVSGQPRAILDTHEDTISLSAYLAGDYRYVWKEYLETVAENSMRGGLISMIDNPPFQGLIFRTPMTLRTDIYIKSLSFSETAGQRDTLSLQMSLVHLPRPNLLSTALDVVNTAVSTMEEVF